MFRAVLIASLALISHGDKSGAWTCFDPDLGSKINCCATSGLCQDSSCTVFGFKNSAKANCHTSGSNPNCPLSVCLWKNPNCPLEDTSNNHCYGRVGCLDPKTLVYDPTNQNCDGYGKLCLEDGNSDNFKICDDACKKDRDCPGTDQCLRKGKDTNCVTAPLSPEVGWNLNLKFQKNKLSADNAVKILKRQYPSLLYVKLFDHDAALIQALRDAKVKNLVVAIPNVELDQVIASTSFTDGIVSGLQGLIEDGIRLTIAIGNEPTLATYGTQFSDKLLPALRAVRASLAKQGFDNVKLTVPFDASILGTSYPPAAGALRDGVKGVVTQVAQFLAAEGSPFFVNLYTYFAYVANLNTVNPIRVEYALLKEPHRATDGITYPNMLAAQVAAMRAALVLADPTLTAAKLRIVIGETGWPTAGEQGATVENSRVFTTNALSSGLDLYAFEAFDEALKSASTGSASGVSSATEANYGWLTEAGDKKFELVAPESATCDQKYPVDGGEFADLDCPPHMLQGWLDGGDCVRDPHCGEDGIVCCKSLPREAILAACPKYVRPGRP